MKTYLTVFLGLFFCIISCTSKDKKQYERNIKYNLAENILSASIVEKDFNFLIKDDGKMKDIEFSGNGFKFTMCQPYSENINYISQNLLLAPYPKSYSLVKSNLKLENSNLNLKNKSTLTLSYFLSFQICKTTSVSYIRDEYILLEKIARSVIKKGDIHDLAGCYLLAGDSINKKITAEIFKTSPFSADNDKIFHELKIDSLLAIYPEILVIDTSRFYQANKDYPQDYNIFFKWRDSLGTVNIELE